MLEGIWQTIPTPRELGRRRVGKGVLEVGVISCVRGYMADHPNSSRAW